MKGYEYLKNFLTKEGINYVEKEQSLTFWYKEVSFIGINQDIPLFILCSPCKTEELSQEELQEKCNKANAQIMDNNYVCAGDKIYCIYCSEECPVSIYKVMAELIIGVGDFEVMLNDENSDEELDNSDEEDYDDSDEEFDDSYGKSHSYCDNYGEYSGNGESHSSLGCLNIALFFIGICFGVFMLLMTLICLVPKGDTEEILWGFAISAIGLLALWLLHKREKQFLSTLIKVILMDLFK